MLLPKCHSGDKIKKTEMGKACSTYREEVHTGFWWGNLSVGGHLENSGVDRRIILNRIFEKWDMKGRGLDQSG